MILLPDMLDSSSLRDNMSAPKRLRDFWPVYLKRSGCPQGGSQEDRRREFAKFQELTVKLYRAGVPILVGTDSPEPNVPPGFSIHQEMGLLVDAGISPAAVLRAATLQNATVLREENRLGSISAGKLADMLLLTANPLNDIRNTRAIQWVIRGG